MCGFTGFTCATFAFTKMPIGDATAIVFSAPAWASIISRVFLKEALGYLDMLAVALGFTGVILLSRPPFLFGDPGGSPVNDQSSSVTDGERAIAPFVAMLGSVGAGAAQVCARKLGMVGGIKAEVVAHAYALFIVVVSPLGFLLPGQAPAFSLTKAGTYIAMVIGILGSAYQLMLNKGMMRVPAGLGSMMRNSDIVASYMWQVVLFGQQVSPLSVAGSVLIVGATVAQAIRKLYEEVKLPSFISGGGEGADGGCKGETCSTSTQNREGRDSSSNASAPLPSSKLPSYSHLPMSTSQGQGSGAVAGEGEGDEF